MAPPYPWQKTTENRKKAQHLIGNPMLYLFFTFYINEFLAGIGFMGHLRGILKKIGPDLSEHHGQI